MEKQPAHKGNIKSKVPVREKNKDEQKSNKEETERPPFVIPGKLYAGAQTSTKDGQSYAPVATTSNVKKIPARAQLAFDPNNPNSDNKVQKRGSITAKPQSPPRKKESLKEPESVKIADAPIEEPLTIIESIPTSRKSKSKSKSPQKPVEKPAEKPEPKQTDNFETSNIPENIEPRFFRTARDQQTPPKISEETKLEEQSHISLTKDADVECPTGDGPIDHLYNEFSYYASVLKQLTPTLTSCATKQRIYQWIDKLYQARYFTSPLILKRNLYLAQLVLTCTNDELYGIFVRKPEEVLPPVENLSSGKIPNTRWERITFWDDLYNAAVEEIDDKEHHILDCSVHGNECTEDQPNERAAGELLDQEFKFFLYIIQPYLTHIVDKKSKLTIALWLQLLSRIQICSCTKMKGIRNDYMQALIGYVQDLRIVSPFNSLPEEDVLLPLAVAVDQLDSKPYGKHFGIEVDSFVSSQPHPKNGAFCYLAISGDMEPIQPVVRPQKKIRKYTNSKPQDTKIMSKTI